MKTVISSLLLVAAFSMVDWMRVKVTWDVNDEPDLAGYSIVYKTPVEGKWKHHEDLDGLPVINGRTGRMLRVPITGLDYHVAIVAYDHSGNRSERSEQTVLIRTADLTAHVIAPASKVSVCPKKPLPPTK